MAGTTAATQIGRLMAGAEVCSTEQVLQGLISEGFRRGDVLAAMASFIEVDSRDLDEDGWHEDDVDVVRDQLTSTRSRPGETARAVRVPDELWQASKGRAAERGETVSDVIRRALRRYVR